ncbi:MAG: radical SAM protein, partial [Nitrospinae bacterium CG11_big_fil_rev_8_21_14_0_20_56_8]
REDLGIHLEHMEWEKFERVVARLGNGEDITLTGWGEPFLHPRIFEMIAHCRERGHRVMITSNGLFPSASHVRQILDSGLDALTFSVDDVNGNVTEGHHNGRVFENIESVARGRANGLPVLRLQATVHAGCENDLYEVIRYAARLGIEVVNVGRLDRKYAPGLKRPGELEEARIFDRADALSRSLGVQLDWLQFSVSRGLTRFFYRLLRRKLHRSGRYCLKTFDYAYVTREGDVTPCCLLPHARMGNLLEREVGDIWNGDRFGHFREHYRDTCGTCDLWTIAQVQEND